MAEREQPLAPFWGRYWYVLLWLALLVLWLPLTQLLLPRLALRLLGSSSLLMAVGGFIVVALQGLAIVLAAVVASAATTAKLLHRPPREVTVRCVWALFGSLWIFLATVITLPVGILLTLAAPLSAWDLLLWLVIALLLAWASLLAAGAAEVGPRRALAALGICLQRAFWIATPFGMLIVSLFGAVLLLFATPLGIHNPDYLLVGAAAATVCAALLAAVWDAARRRAAPKRRVVRPLPQASGLQEAGRLLGFLRGGERI